MKDVLVVNLNLAVDKTAVVKSFRKNHIYRLGSVKTLPGGKGVNVARALKSLGTSSRLLGFVAGHNGRWIAENLALEGLASVCVPYGPGESRVCYSVVDERGVSTDFNEEGPVVPPGAQSAFIRRYKQFLPRCGAVALCGRIFPGLRKGFYGGLVQMAKAAGKVSAFDTSGEALLEGMDAGAAVIKMNRHEFREVSGLPLLPRNVRDFSARALRRGTRLFIVTDGPSAAYAVSGTGLLKLVPAALGKIATTVGAGDSFLAGLLHAFIRGMTVEDSFRLSLGTSASDCLSLGAGVVKRSQWVRFAREAIVRAA